MQMKNGGIEMRIELNQNYFYDNLIEDAEFLGNTYPDLIQVEEIGISYDNRRILMIKVGKGSTNVICVAGVHGRESINTIVMMKMIESYCLIYENQNGVPVDDAWKQRITDYLNTHSIYFIPLLNPDGYMIALQGFDVIQNQELREHAKSMGIPYTEWKFNARGIDINRNFPSVTWRAKSPVPNGLVYSGDMPASELETRALIDVFSRIESVGFLDYHSRGKVIYYYRHAMPKEYNDRQLILAREIAYITGYILGNPQEEFGADMVGGNTVHYYSETFSKPAITIETVRGDAPFPLNIIYQQDTYTEILKTPFVLQ